MSKVNQTQEELEKLKKEEEQREKRKQEILKKREEYKLADERKAKQKKIAEELLEKQKKKSEWYTNPYYLTFGGLGALMLYVIVMLFLNQTPPLHKTPVIDEKKIEEHNQSFPWSQGPSSFWEGATLADAKRIFTTTFSNKSNLHQCHPDESTPIPDKFDAREVWPDCMHKPVNQNRKCDGSYAIALTQTLAERECIASKDHKLKTFSAQELLSCEKLNQGCRGGSLNTALDYLVKTGVAGEECFPYKGTNDVTCDQMCATPEREKLGNYCIVLGEEAIKREIIKNGPVVSVMQVYSDFLNYKSKIYIKGDDVPRFSGYIAVKIIGWGVGDESEGETGEGYWLVQPSWGADWGENGVAKIGEKQQFLYEEYAYSLQTTEQILQLQMAAQAAQQAQQAKAKEGEAPKVEDIPDMNLDDDKKE